VAAVTIAGAFWQVACSMAVLIRSDISSNAFFIKKIKNKNEKIKNVESPMAMNF
jgi:hypothetical protein